MSETRDQSRTSPRPTLKTIAAATGLAIATVSRALNDAADIGEATKSRVRDAAKQLGYRPNRAGVRLRTGKTNVIALVLSTEQEVMNHTSQLIYSIAAALRGSAYHMVVMPYFPDEDPMTPVRYIVETESADGVILNQTTADDPRVRYMHERGVPFATHGRTSSGIVHPYFDFDNEAFARISVQALAERGRKHLLLVAPPRAHCYAQHQIAGYLDACASLGLRGEILDTANSDSGASAIEEAVFRRFSQSDAPDGLLLGSTTAAMHSVAGAEKAGLRMGIDFDAAAKEAIRFLHSFRKEMIVVHEDVGRAGDFVARAVVAAIEGQEPALGQFLDQPTGLSTD